MSTPFLVAVEICQLCGNSSKVFTCKNCVQTGNFTHTNNNGAKKTSFASKKKRLKVVIAVRQSTVKRLETSLKPNKTQPQIEDGVKLRNRIEILKELVKREKETVEKSKCEIAELEKEIEIRKCFVDRVKEKIDQINANPHYNEGKSKHERRKEKLSKKLSTLQTLRADHVTSLVTDIFPLSDDIPDPPSSLPDSPTHNTLIDTDVGAMLEEATRTILVGGEWVQTRPLHPHTILNVPLPPTQDFIKYYQWLKSYRDAPRNPECQPALHTYKVLGIPAALSYSARLVDVLSFILGVNLPNKIDYNDFGVLQVSRKRLFESVSRLCENVLHLCRSQHVPEVSSLQNILKNIQACIDSPHLGRQGSFESALVSVVYTEDFPFESDSSAEELNFSDTQEEEDSEDWDRLPDREEVISVSPTDVNQQSQSITASALMTSAASVASALWPWKR